ncbi:unnamed protein product [Mytilus coruscus]|uniref:B box-type domain-containing protein n=1 Tax=Mytilus coruscus TaxID=42192 RepID=A0A6J8BN21_MYTCO|nr:unnamed protein product [Mytilus coruscus]
MLKSAGAYICCRSRRKTTEIQVLDKLEKTSNTKVSLQSYKATSLDKFEADKLEEQIKQQRSRVSKEKKKRDIKMSENEFCDPCSSANIQVAATHYCQLCEEKYCDNCTASHQNQKLTKDHKIIDNNMIRKMCDPCSVNHKETKGSYVCEECEEFLCIECKQNHILQKSNQDHNVKSIMEEILCEACRRADRREHAALYCQECEDPEPLCQSCATQHQAMKKTRNHQLSTDIATYILRHKKEVILKVSEKTETTGTDTDQGSDQPTCEPCTFNNRTRKAAHYCKDCEEMYCFECMSKHTTQKNSSTHEVVQLKDVLKTLKICEPCNFNGNEVNATHKCEDCEEYLCEDCKKNHLSSKKQRQHKIVPMASSFLCINCQGPGIVVKATYFCKNCENLLCEVCTEDHKAMKMTRDHVLTTELAGSIILKEKRQEASNRSQTDIHDKDEDTRDKNPLVHGNERSTLKVGQTVAVNRPHQNCDPCVFSGKTANATYYCKECEEYFCYFCMQYHGAQNKSHAVNNLNTTSIMCVTCKKMDKDFEALTFCLDCNEPMCQACAERHHSMKKSRIHRLDSSYIYQG